MFVSALSVSAWPHLPFLWVYSGLKYVHKFLGTPIKQRTPPLCLCIQQLAPGKQKEGRSNGMRFQRMSVFVFYCHITNYHEFNEHLLSHSSRDQKSRYRMMESSAQGLTRLKSDVPGTEISSEARSFLLSSYSWQNSVLCSFRDWGPHNLADSWLGTILSS